MLKRQRCHGLAPWFSSRLQLPRHEIIPMDATALCRGASRSELHKRKRENPRGKRVASRNIFWITCSRKRDRPRDKPVASFDSLPKALSTPTGGRELFHHRPKVVRVRVHVRQPRVVAIRISDAAPNTRSTASLHAPWVLHVCSYLAMK